MKASQDDALFEDLDAKLKKAAQNTRAPAPEQEEGDLGIQMRDLKQNERGIQVHVDRSRDALLTEFGKATLKDRYLMQDESYQDMF
ncbi:MAG TPA: hypothetical protein DCG04_13350, partial [Rhodospirillaceae bacterium]|nr:hypothetical protein [Rhodospirillaceae bacterium]